MKERRDNLRIDLSGAVSYEACSSVDTDTADDLQKCNGTVVNVSGSGLCFDTADDVRESEIVKINIPMPGMQIQIPTLAMVMWKKQIDTGSRVGMMFVI